MPASALHLSQALGHEAADKRLDILRRIDAAGSISEAARAAGVSYKAAWQAIETLSNLAGTALVEKVVGGSGGGGAQLTATGRRLLEVADRLAAARSAVLAGLASAGDEVRGSGLLALGLRTSMRNQLPCTVSSLAVSGGAVLVTLALSDDSTLRSRITSESAELLGLKAGLPLIALCKATAVTVGADFAASAGSNLLAGTISRATPASDDREVSLRLASGIQLVGFASETCRLPVGRTAVARVDEAAIVLALGA